MDYQPKLVLDSRIHDISDRVDVAVESSGSQSTYQPFPAVNSSNNSVTFNVNVPSENIAVDRRVLFQSDFNFTVTIGPTTAGNIIPEGQSVFQWGTTDGLGQFPMNGAFSQVQATINNISLNVPLDDVMPSLLRMCDQEEVSCMNLTTASYLDQNYANLPDVIYSQAFGVIQPFANPPLYFMRASSNPLNGSETLNYNNKIQPRGVIVPTLISVVHSGTSGGTTNNSVLSTGNTNEKWVISVSLRLTEPFLFLSPFSGLVKSKNEACFLGINNMNIVANITQNLAGVYKTTNDFGINIPVSCALGLPDGTPLFSNPRLLMNLLTLQPEQYSRINTKNVLPIQSYPRFVSSFSGTIANNASETFTFPIIQLNQIPDTILIFVRPPKNEVSSSGSQYKKQTQFLSIQNASISFNNASGILASASPEELYNLSKYNGSKQSWQEFLGFMNVGRDPSINGGVNSAFKLISTQGSLLVVKPAYNFNLPSFLSGGSLGQYGLQVTLQCTNRLGQSVTNPEMCVVTVQSGIMVTSQGSSSLYSGLLTKDMVLQAKQQKPVIDSSTYSNLVGGSVQESCKTALRNVMKKHMGSSSGAGRSGGAMHGSGKSGGMMDKMSKYS